MGSWNIRGLNGFSKQHAVRNWISDSSLGLIDSLHSSLQEITCRVTHVSEGFSFGITFVYGSNDPGNHRNLWDFFRDQVAEFDSEGLPWLVLGDFNAILGAFDRVGGDPMWYGYMDDFGHCIHDTKLIGAPFTGLWYTWHNSQQGDGIILWKLNWVFASLSWFIDRQTTVSEFRPRDVSNHSFMVVRFGSRCGKKLGLLKRKLKSLHVRDSSHISSRVIEARAQWATTQANLDWDPLSTECISQERNLVNRYFGLYRDEEVIFKQRSCVQWLNLGDQNTKFFHKSLIHRQVRNLIHSLTDGNGSSCCPYSTSDRGGFQVFFGHISSDMTSPLTTPITDDEIRTALFSILDDKAPGPDGYTSLFFKRAWEIISTDFRDAVRYFFVTNEMPRCVNATKIALVPKVDNPSRMTDFKPISCCNVLYKCVTKVIVNQFKVVLPVVIGSSLLAFVPGRRISDNILLT
ncbi:uncharacterized protein LOC116146875 [Pistacia vera]|uniref:uncharacterized protein LOC116146875 n=1 Tax=Pistacia vera TaxID=55513 RepID=UPI0012637417|nr:uncharacterized protein LOC116146875 [Pistacia vera]